MSPKIKKNTQSFPKVFGFFYSFITTGLILTYLVFIPYYHVKLGGGDWGYLNVIFGWIALTIVSVPLFIYTISDIKKQLTNNDKRSLRISLAIISPTIFGYLLLIILTITGRMMFQPIYAKKKSILESAIIATPISGTLENPEFDPQCRCVRRKIKGTIELHTTAGFPVVAHLESSIPQSVCMIGTELSHEIQSLNETLHYTCFINDFARTENSMDTYSIIMEFQEKNNDAVTVTKSFSSDTIQQPQ